MKRIVLIFMLCIYCDFGYSANDTTKMNRENLEVYPLFEYGFNKNNQYKNPHHYSIHNVSIGCGVNFYKARLEFSYPFIQSFDSVVTFKNTYSISLGYSFDTKTLINIVPKINYMMYKISENRIAYDRGQPNVSVPVSYIFEMEIKKLTYSIGIEKDLRNIFV